MLEAPIPRPGAPTDRDDNTGWSHERTLYHGNDRRLGYQFDWSHEYAVLCRARRTANPVSSPPPFAKQPAWLPLPVSAPDRDRARPAADDPPNQPALPRQHYKPLPGTLADGLVHGRDRLAHRWALGYVVGSKLILRRYRRRPGVVKADRDPLVCGGKVAFGGNDEVWVSCTECVGSAVGKICINLKYIVLKAYPSASGHTRC